MRPRNACSAGPLANHRFANELRRPPSHCQPGKHVLALHIFRCLLIWCFDGCDNCCKRAKNIETQKCLSSLNVLLKTLGPNTFLFSVLFLFHMLFAFNFCHMSVGWPRKSYLESTSWTTSSLPGPEAQSQEPNNFSYVKSKSIGICWLTHN